MPLPLGQAGRERRLDEQLPVGRRTAPAAVFTLLPNDGVPRRTVDDEQLEGRPLGQRQAEAPLGELPVVEGHHALPAVEALRGDGQLLVGADVGSHDAQQHLAAGGLSYRSGLGGTLRTALPTGKHRPREGRREEGGSGGKLLPAVADADLAAGEPARQTEPVAAPLGADADPLALDRIAVGRSVASARCVADAAPEPVFHIVQDDAPPAPEEHELLAPLGAVFDFKEEFHRPEYVWGGF